MRHSHKLALFTALLLTGTSFAATSTPTDYNTATMDLSASGQAGTAVSFTVPSTTVSIPSSQVRPGNSFTVTIPVSNPTDREIVVTVTDTKSGDLSGKLTVTAVNDSVTIAPGGTGNLVYTFAFDAAAPGDQTIAGQAFSVAFAMSAVGTYAPTQNSSF